jgi:hypothetical protein
MFWFMLSYLLLLVWYWPITTALVNFQNHAEQEKPSEAMNLIPRLLQAMVVGITAATLHIIAISLPWGEQLYLAGVALSIYYAETLNLTFCIWFPRLEESLLALFFPRSPTSKKKEP